MNRVGQLGEDAFKYWCTQVGAIASRPSEDLNGWDFYVEDTESPEYPGAEVHRAAFECKVQVKSTNGKKKSKQLSLSVLKKLATSNSPSFILFLHFDDKSEPQRAYLRHLDEPLIKKVLTRVRSLDTGPQKGQYHKIKMTIPYDDSHRVPVIGGSLLSHMKTIVGSDVGLYVEKKKRYLRTVGYDGEGSMEISLQLDRIENLPDLIDASIGFDRTVKINRMEAYGTRFGIKDASPMIREDEGVLSFPRVQPSEQAEMLFSRELHSPETLSFSMNFFRSPFNAFVPREEVKVRVKGEFLDVVLAPWSPRSTVQFFFPDRWPDIRDLRKFFTLVAWSKEGVGIYTDVIPENGGKMSFTINAISNAENLPYPKEGVGFIDDAIFILEHYGVQDEVEVNYGYPDYLVGMRERKVADKLNPQRIGWLMAR